MTLTIHTEEDDKRQLTFKIEVEEARVQKAMRVKAREFAREIHVPGFRKGKAPYGVIVRRVGADALRAEAVEDMIQPVFEEALTQEEIVPYAQPSLDDMVVEPLQLTFTVPLEPVVTLGDYRALRKEIEPISVTDEAVEEALEQVQLRHQNIEEVERPVEEGDVVTFAGIGQFLSPSLKTEEAEEEIDAEEVVEDDSNDETVVEEIEETSEEEDATDEDEPYQPETIFEDDNLELLMDSEKLFPGTPFVENFVGLEIGDDAEFSFTFPEDFEEADFAGRDAEFNITILNVKNRDLPALDDELAKSEGNYETLDELRASLRADLQKQAEEEAKNELIEGMIDDMLDDTEMVFPSAAVDMEVDAMLEEFKAQVTRSGWEFEDYLKMQNSTEDSLREDFRENGEVRLRRRLIFRQLILDEKLQVKAEDVDAIIEERVSRFADNEELQEMMRNFYRNESGFDSISGEVLSDKVYERIQAIYAGEAPDLDALEAETAVADEEE